MTGPTQPGSRASAREDAYMDDNWRKNNLDSKAIHVEEESAMALNAFDHTGGFVTIDDGDRCEQFWLSRERLMWLRDHGITEWLAEMDAAGGSDGT